MTAFLPEIDGKRIAIPHRFQARIFFQTRLRHDRTRIYFSRRAGFGLTAAISCALLISGSQVTVILERKILSPNGRILRIVSEFDDTKKRILGLLLTLHYV